MKYIHSQMNESNVYIKQNYYIELCLGQMK